ncbi:MAG: CRTAC1 family protein [Acidobacteriota bacterium]|nr:CRTAC1 family protein [Acidobacteriota bacterium]
MPGRGLAATAVLAASLAAATGHATGASDFAESCRRLQAGSNPYFGTGIVGALEAELASAPGGVATRLRLGRELLRLGDTMGAIEHLSMATATLEATATSDPTTVQSAEWSLALAHMQRAEDLNCIHHGAGDSSRRISRSADSCILPLSASAVHARPEHARTAGDHFLSILRSGASGPRQARARWLLNLARRLSGDFPDGVPAEHRIEEDVFIATGSYAGGRWRNLGPELGVDVLDLAGGAVVDDFDGDGLLDLITSSWDPCGPLRAFRNDGRGSFEDVGVAWGLDGQTGGLNLVHADYDDDGRLDLFVLRGAWLLEDGRIRNSLLRNELDGDQGRFVDVTEAARLADPAYPTQTAAWGDYDGDGDLDLYVGNEATEAHSYPSQLFRNQGDGTFEDVAASAGVTNLRYAKGVAWGDADNDGDLDLYVSNFGSNRLYVNADGTFVDAAVQVGVTEPERESFASWFFDYDHDGDLDLYVGDYRPQAAEVMASFAGSRPASGQPLVYRNDCGPEPGCGGRLRMTEVSRELGIRRPAMPMGANYGDLDNDGWLDFYLGTGEPDLASLMPNVMYRYDGLRFEEVTFAGGFGHLQKGHGVGFGDLDGDGDMDLLHQLGGFYPTDTFGNALFENPGNGNAWVTLRFAGAGAAAGGANRFGVGSRVAIAVDRPNATRRTIHRLVGSGGSFGGNSLQLEVGLGDATRIAEIHVRWAGSGAEQRFRDVEPRKVYEVIEGTETLQTVVVPTFRLRGTR